MRRERRLSRSYRTPARARRQELDGSGLDGLPVGTVRKFSGERFAFVATKIASGRWMIHGRALSVATDLAGLASVEQERRPGADPGW